MDFVREPRCLIAWKGANITILDTSTAGFVLIMSHSCGAISNQIDLRLVAETWRKCEEILTHMASFSISARNSLQFLQVTHHHIVQNYTGMYSSYRRLRMVHPD